VAALLTLGAPLLRADTKYLDFENDGAIGVPEAGANDTLTLYHAKAQGGSFSRGGQVQVLKSKDFVDIHRGLYELNFSQDCNMTVRVLRGVRDGRYFDFQATPEAVPNFKQLDSKGVTSFAFNPDTPVLLKLDFDRDTRKN
jgi:hypothetical protein